MERMWDLQCLPRTSPEFQDMVSAARSWGWGGKVHQVEAGNAALSPLAWQGQAMPLHPLCPGGSLALYFSYSAPSSLLAQTSGAAADSSLSTSWHHGVLRVARLQAQNAVFHSFVCLQDRCSPATGRHLQQLISASRWARQL